MTYAIKEIFYSVQGEGANVGRPAIFVRFSGCNLWSGREEDRATAVCKFCDTDFRGTDGTHGGKYESAADVAKVVVSRVSFRPLTFLYPLIVCTGGEPLLQLDSPLIDSFHFLGFEVAVETNGTLPVPEGIDWVCVSPKTGAKLVEAMQNLVWGRTIALWTPFIDLDKAGVVALGDELGVPFVATWTCYGGAEEHCGRCGACVERRLAFPEAGVTDPTRYKEGLAVAG